MKKAISLFFILIALLSVTDVHAEQDQLQWKLEARENLFDRYNYEMSQSGKNPARAQQMNDFDIQKLMNTPEPQDDIRATSITSEQAQEVFDFALNHPVVGGQALYSYDPQLIIGFCFGRATFVHLELLRRGVHKESVRKIFAIGSMKTGEIHWQFHVATAVRGPQGAWLVIDPLFAGHVMSLQDWMSMVKEISTDGALRFYPTHPSKFGPSAFMYNKMPFGGVTDKIYNNYFTDMFRSFKQNPVLKSYKKK